MNPKTENAKPVSADAELDAVQEVSPIIQDAAAAAPAQEDKPMDPVQADPESYVRFHKPYLFEGSQYAGIDLKAIENLTAKDMCEAEKYLSRQGIISPLPEMTMEYIAFISKNHQDNHAGACMQ